MKAHQEKTIRAIVKTAVETYASTFAERHIRDLHNPKGTLNMKIHNVFIAALGKDIQYYTALVRSLDSSLGNMLETLAVNIARLSYRVERHVEGPLHAHQTAAIAEILESYRRRSRRPTINDYATLREYSSSSRQKHQRHESDYYLYDSETEIHHLMELKIGGDLDNKKARSEKEALLEQYAILSNVLGAHASIQIHFATAYNRFGEGNDWRQERVLQYFAKEELLISSRFWNFVAKADDGYSVVIDEYGNNARTITRALDVVKEKYVP